MAQLSYSRYRFPADVIHRAIWMYLRFTLSYRDVEDLLAERGIEASYESIRRWVLTFGPVIARRLLDVSRTLAALSRMDRCRLRILLEGVAIHARDPAFRKAIDVMLRLAKDAWVDTSPNSEAAPSRH
jgi:putative transposase